MTSYRIRSSNCRNSAYSPPNPRYVFVPGEVATEGASGVMPVEIRRFDEGFWLPLPPEEVSFPANSPDFIWVVKTRQAKCANWIFARGIDRLGWRGIPKLPKISGKCMRNPASFRHPTDVVGV